VTRTCCRSHDLTISRRTCRWHTRAYLYARATLLAVVVSLIAAGGLMVMQEVGR
jgi:hypothetical protein